MLAGVAGCKSSTTEVETPVATTITLSRTTVSFEYLGQVLTVVATVRDQNGDALTPTVTWSTADPDVATVDESGQVRASANGSTTLTARVGELAATAEVTVAQVGSRVIVREGDGQEGIAETALSDTLVAVVTDLGGSPVAGVEVTFTPSVTAGTVTPTTMASDDRGEVRAVWTLGVEYGPQEVVVSIPGAQARASAFAFAETPTPDLLFVSSLALTPRAPTNLETVRLRATVRNQGDLTTGSGWAVQVLVNGAEVLLVDQPPLGAREEVVLELDVGPFATGATAFTLVLDPADALGELIETNNRTSKTVGVLAQSIVSVGSTVSSLSAAEGEQLLFRLDVPPGSAQAMTISLNVPADTSQDVDLFVVAGDRPTAKESYDDCISASIPGKPERCQILDPEGTYHILLDAFYAFSGVTMTVALADSVIPFDIRMEFVGTVPNSVRTAALAAVARWEEIIVGDIPDYPLPGPVDAEGCAEGAGTLSGTIDDVVLYVRVAAIDGASGTLAQAGYCGLRGLSDLPWVGSLEIDDADLSTLESQFGLEDVIVHEVGHILGFGTIWTSRGLLVNPSLPSNTGADTHFIGAGAIEAFDDAGGTGYPDGKVPVKNEAGPGSSDGHWRESVLDTELMTPFYESVGTRPLSAVTVRSMGDVGYPVDPASGQPYVLPPIVPLRAQGVEGTGAGSGLVLDLSGDVRYVPPIFVDGKRRGPEILR